MCTQGALTFLRQVVDRRVVQLVEQLDVTERVAQVVLLAHRPVLGRLVHDTHHLQRRVSIMYMQSRIVLLPI